jgi:hypothetical protein
MTDSVFVQGDLSNPVDLQHLADLTESFDIIIDDGSHASPHQQLAFKYLFPKLGAGGVYVIEDLHWQSPVYETLIPGTPKTSDFFEAFLYEGRYIPNPILTESEMESARCTMSSYAIFPLFNGAASGP